MIAAPETQNCDRLPSLFFFPFFSRVWLAQKGGKSGTKAFSVFSI
jgi:hypothetical protein